MLRGTLIRRPTRRTVGTLAGDSPPTVVCMCDRLAIRPKRSRSNGGCCAPATFYCLRLRIVLGVEEDDDRTSAQIGERYGLARIERKVKSGAGSPSRTTRRPFSSSTRHAAGRRLGLGSRRS